MKTDEPEDVGFPPNPVDKPGYRLEFNDDFVDENLDTSKWLPFYLPQWSSRELAAARYSLKGSRLQLFIEEDQRPWCPTCDGTIRVSSLQTGCYSGPAGSSIGQHRFKPKLTVTEAQPTLKLYTPQYGYFETRLKAIPIPGYMVALWMIGFEERPEQSAEICICEIFGNDVGRRASKVGYGIRPFSDPSITNDFHKSRVCMQTHLEPNQDHGDGQHGGVTIRQLVVAGRHPAKLLQAVDQPLHLIALPVEFSIKRPGRMFVLLPRDRRPNTSPVQVLAIFPESIALIARHPLRTDTKVTIAPSDRTLFQKPFSHGDLVLLTRS
jgi:hypothetical protein